MKEKFNDTWDEIKDAWRSSSQTEKIELQVSSLVAELKSKVNEFEKNSIKNDIKWIKSSVSDFERNSIKKDITKITASIKKIIRYFKKKKE